MIHRHRQPCNECPWRKAAPAGWLGGHSPEYYADAVQANEVPACHLSDFGSTDPRTAMCAGALSVMANGATSAWRTPGGDEARVLTGRREDTFGHFTLFYQHHAGKPWVHPLLRGGETVSHVGRVDPDLPTTATQRREST